MSYWTMKFASTEAADIFVDAISGGGAPTPASPHMQTPKDYNNHVSWGGETDPEGNDTLARMGIDTGAPTVKAAALAQVLSEPFYDPHGLVKTALVGKLVTGGLKAGARALGIGGAKTVANTAGKQTAQSLLSRPGLLGLKRPTAGVMAGTGLDLTLQGQHARSTFR